MMMEIFYRIPIVYLYFPVAIFLSRVPIGEHLFFCCVVLSRDSIRASLHDGHLSVH